MNKNEIKFHNLRYRDGDDNRKGFEKFYTVTIQSQNFFKNKFTEIVNKKTKPKVLDYGCGIDAHGYLGTDNNNKPEKIFSFYKKHSLNFYGIDISDQAIKIAKQNSKKINFPAKYFQMNAEQTNFDDGTFDLIFGKGIIHHLNFNKAIPELKRILKSNGSCLFFEPLDHNPIIKMGRILTPNKRTPDEHPIKISDKKIFNKYFKNVTFHSFCFISIFAFIFYKTPVFNKILKRFEKIDQYLLKRFPFFKRYGWIVIIELSSPRH